MFTGTGLEVMEDIKKRLESELKDKDLPYQRKEEVESLIYYIDTWVKEKGGK